MKPRVKISQVPQTDEGIAAFVQWLKDEAHDEILCGRPNKASKLLAWANLLSRVV